MLKRGLSSMGVFSPKSTTVITAALETAGATIQSDMLDFVSSASGQTMAGFLYLLAIVSAIVVFASGGNYRWARYLLIGPVLFFFLTNVRTQSDGTEWSFANKDFSQEAITKVLRGVDAPSNGGGTSVALVYHFWNGFMSELVQELIKLLNLTESDSQFTFIQKVERYMQNWNFSSIKDRELRALIKLTLSSQCKDYFHHLRIANNPASLYPEAEASRKLIETLKDRPVLVTQNEGMSDILYHELYGWLKDRNMLNTTYTCQSMWERLISEVKKDVKDSLNKTLGDSIAPGQKPEAVKQAFYDHIGVYHEKYSGKINDDYVNPNAAALYALDWITARSLYLEIWDQNPYVAQQTMTPESDYFQMGDETYLPGQAASFNEDATKSIQQFNITDKYAQRGEFVAAALSLPYFQGVGLLILSAAYPFFAMMVVLPGRALSFFTWMGLWAWLKLWDLGFAVVMLLDNMLYAMFPRGPNLTGDDINNAGVAWAKILEVDPNFSQAVYYNLIGTCLFAVPLVTGIFVKGGGGELVNLINQGWSAYAMRIAGASASYARSYQAQGYMGDLQRQIFKGQQKAANDFITSHAADYKAIEDLTTLAKSLEANINAGKFTKEVADLKKIVIKSYEEQIRAIDDKLKTGKAAAVAKRAAEDEMTYGAYAANRAVASRYYSHDLSNYRGAAYSAEFNAMLAEDYYDTTKEATAMADATANVVINRLKAAGGAK